MTILDETYLCTFNTNQKNGSWLWPWPRNWSNSLCSTYNRLNHDWKSVTFQEQYKHLISPITFLLPRRVKIVIKWNFVSWRLCFDVKSARQVYPCARECACAFGGVHGSSGKSLPSQAAGQNIRKGGTREEFFNLKIFKSITVCQSIHRLNLKYTYFKV